MSGLPRELIKWLQSLDLTHPIKNIKRDFSNGYLVAEILAWYYVHDIQMHSFSNGNSLQAKQGNWQQLELFITKEKLNIPKEYIEGTIHCKPTAAKLLLESLYSQLTLKELRYLPPKTYPDDFTDKVYQSQLPHYARSTAAQSIKSNLTNTELLMEPDQITSVQKAQAIVEAYDKQKRNEKETFPDRFAAKPKGNKKSPQKTDGDPLPSQIEEIQVKQTMIP